MEKYREQWSFLPTGKVTNEHSGERHLSVYRHGPSLMAAAGRRNSIRFWTFGQPVPEYCRIYSHVDHKPLK